MLFRSFIDVSSEPGRGTTFKIYLPRHGDAEGASQTHPASDKAPRGKETILLTEDEPAVLALTAKQLDALGYTVLEARTPDAALRISEQYPGEVDLLITDVIMPDMNGRDLSRQLSSGRPRIKNLFMSGYTADVIAHHGVLEEGVHFIQKPFSATDLAVKVRKVLDSD